MPAEVVVERLGCTALFLTELRRSAYTMPESSNDIAKAATHVVELETALSCPHQTRRSLLFATLATGACLVTAKAVAQEEDQPGSDERPQKGDLLVLSEGPRPGEVIKPTDLALGGPPIHAWPKDPKTAVIRKGSRLNEVVLVKLDPGELDDETRARSVEGIVAYSAICSHAGCPVSDWVKQDGGDKDIFKCPCHNSEYDPRHSAQVVSGPAPRRLAALPLALENGSLIVSAKFVGKVGAQQAG
jgi:Rieske Fe-S protein